MKLLPYVLQTTKDSRVDKGKFTGKLLYIKIKIGDIQCILYFSKNLFLDINELTLTGYDHHRGGIITFNRKLTALGGEKNRNVEVEYDGREWNATIIPPIGNREGRSFPHFTSLSLHSTLFIFSPFEGVWKYSSSFGLWQKGTPVRSTLRFHHTLYFNDRVWHLIPRCDFCNEW